MIPDNSYRNRRNSEYADVNLSKEKSYWNYIQDFYADRIWKILLGASIMLIIISLAEDYDNILDMRLGNWMIGATFLGMILIIMLLNVMIETCKQNSILRMLRAMEYNVEATVIRDGKEFLIRQSELLVGDVIVLSGGDSVPADCLVIEANLQAQVDESYLTPDINPVQKKPIKIFEESMEKKVFDSKQSDDSMESPDPFLLASTLVVAGRLKALV